MSRHATLVLKQILVFRTSGSFWFYLNLYVESLSVLFLTLFVHAYYTRRLGLPCLMNCFTLRLNPSQKNETVLDRFLIYGEEYKKIREAMAKTALSGRKRELSKALKVPKIMK